MADLGPCGIEDCRKAATRRTAHGNLCETHRKRLSPSRAGGVGLTAPVQARIEDPREKLYEAAHELSDAEADEEYAKAEQDIESAAIALVRVKKARGKLDKAAEAYGSLRLRERIRAGMAQAKAEGVRMGRPPKLDFHAAVHAVKSAGGVAAAAQALGVSENAVRRALKRLPSVTLTLSEGAPAHGDLHALKESFRPPEPPDSEES